MKNKALKYDIVAHYAENTESGINIDLALSEVSGALDSKVDKVEGKELSTNDFTDEYEEKLDSIETGAQVNIQSDWNETDVDSDAYIKNKPTIPEVPVQDVEVNGISVLNEEGIAEITVSAQVNADWNSVTGVSEILNKPENLVQDQDYVHTDNNFTDEYEEKLDNIAASAEVNVQSDWNVSDVDSDAYIKNKPAVADPSDVPDSAYYDTSTKKILFKHGNTTLFDLDATAFVKDGMVDTVVIENGYLVITFNTDAGKETISIPITDIFDPSNYYNKTDSDARFATTAQGALADTAYQLPNSGIPKSDLSQGVQDSLGLADTALQSVPVFAGSTPGLVPTATSGDADKALRGDGTWGDVSSVSVSYDSVNEQIHLDFSVGQ